MNCCSRSQFMWLTKTVIIISARLSRSTGTQVSEISVATSRNKLSDIWKHYFPKVQE